MYRWLTLSLAGVVSATLHIGGCFPGDLDNDDKTGDGCTADADCRTLGEICMAEKCQPDPDLSEGLDEAAAGEMGQIDNGMGGADEPTEVGAVIDSFCGVDAHQNGPHIAAVHGNSPFGYKWQCTELAYRFTCLHYGLCEKKTGPYGHAKAWFENKKDSALKQLNRYPNGGTEPPAPGDILVWGNGKYGHVAIVKTVLDDAVHVLEQNNYKGTHVYAMSTAGGAYSIKSALGWMRVPGSVPACSQGDSSHPATATLTSPAPGAMVEGAFAVTGTSHDANGLEKVTVTLNTSLGASVCNGDCIGVEQPINTIVDPTQYGIPSGSQITIAVWIKDSLQNLAGPLSARTITWHASTQQLCGDGVCTGTETQTACCLDCGCPSGKLCQGNACVDGETCGDGQCGGPESQATCCADCGCPSGKTCKGNVCVNTAVCGDTICDAGENQSSCCADCGCSNGQACQNGGCSCPSGNYGQFSILNNVYQAGAPQSFGAPGCSGDGTMMLKAAAAMISPSVLRIYIRKADDTPFSSAAQLTLYVGNGPTCPSPPNVPKATQDLTLGQVEQFIDLTVNPYNGTWNVGETKQLWVGKSEGGYPAWRSTGVISVTRTCM